MSSAPAAWRYPEEDIPVANTAVDPLTLSPKIFNHLFEVLPRSNALLMSGTIEEDISPPKLIKSVLASPTVMLPPITTLPLMSALPVSFKLEPVMCPVVLIFKVVASKAVPVTFKLLVAPSTPALLKSTSVLLPGELKLPRERLVNPEPLPVMNR